jgi:hypothetical protein
MYIYIMKYSSLEEKIFIDTCKGRSINMDYFLCQTESKILQTVAFKVAYF